MVLVCGRRGTTLFCCLKRCMPAPLLYRQRLKINQFQVLSLWSFLSKGRFRHHSLHSSVSHTLAATPGWPLACLKWRMRSLWWQGCSRDPVDELTCCLPWEALALVGWWREQKISWKEIHKMDWINLEGLQCCVSFSFTQANCNYL